MLKKSKQQKHRTQREIQSETPFSNGKIKNPTTWNDWTIPVYAYMFLCKADASIYIKIYMICLMMWISRKLWYKCTVRT